MSVQGMRLSKVAPKGFCAALQNAKSLESERCAQATFFVWPNMTYLAMDRQKIQRDRRETGTKRNVVFISYFRSFSEVPNVSANGFGPLTMLWTAKSAVDPGR
ncbi:hypothetical protein N7457_001531 [Penicillium paradoxum]|uniref:uncharacterized protein n=1 Tax=Penicillium paradoxum TaxID=176176 RepID=UPI002548FEE4|nr:uncharacterized protein N7457_001531 [Penicillium paradoxum]KAJ5794932.1 hypothetical protein N7457_001531 [Penicillium paradoxum]